MSSSLPLAQARFHAGARVRWGGFAPAPYQRASDPHGKVMGLGAEAEVVGFADGAWTLRTLRDGALVRADEPELLFDYTLEEL